MISPLYIQMKTAKEWGKWPYDFFARPYAERMLMVGFDIVESKMTAYEHEYAERQAKLNKGNVK